MKKTKEVRAWALVRDGEYYRSANYSVCLFTSRTHARDVNAFVRRDGYDGYEPMPVSIVPVPKKRKRK